MTGDRFAEPGSDIGVWTTGTEVDEIQEAARHMASVTRWDQWRVSWVIVDALFIWQDWLIQIGTGFKPSIGHCQRAYQSEVNRLQLPPEYRE